MKECGTAISDWMQRFRAQFRYSSAAARRVHGEIQDHLMDSVMRLEQRGLEQAEAERLAVEAFGPPELIVQSFDDEGGPMVPERLARWSAPLGAVLALPGVVFVISNILKYNLGSGTLYDGAFGSIFALGFGELNALVNAFVIVGPILAVILLGVSSIEVGMKREGSAYLSTISIRLDKATIAVLAVSVAVLGAMFAYVIFEIAPCWFGGRVEC